MVVLSVVSQIILSGGLSLEMRWTRPNASRNAKPRFIMNSLRNEQTTRNAYISPGRGCIITIAGASYCNRRYNELDKRLANGVHIDLAIA